ncbi:MAG: hypothetical protein ACJASQ_004286 [Crocinitomicaceae bacterium]|jgi:hypothetical protein
MQLQKNIVLLAIGLVTLLSCKKEEVANTCASNINSDCEHIANVKNYFHFGVGSWWVYEEESSGTLDTITVTWSVEDQTSYNFITETYSSHQDYYFEYKPLPSNGSGNSCPNNNVICDRCIRVMKLKFNSIETIGGTACFSFIPKIGDTMYNYQNGQQLNKIYVTNKLDSFDLGSLSFGRTICVAEEITAVELNQPTFHYYSNGVGLIKKELLYSDEVWNLIDYHIEE